MNVLHVHSGNIFGGVERMLETLAPATAGDIPIRSSFALCFEGRVGDTLRAAGADVHHLGPVHARRIHEIWRARRALLSVLNAERWTAAVVHSAWSQAIFGPTILKSKTPLVRWLHAPRPGPHWLEYWSRRSCPSLVLCNSYYTREAARLRLGDIPAAVQYPPAVAFSKNEQARSRLRRELGTGSDEVVIIIAARMEAWKGHDLLLKSLSTLPPGGWEVWVAGGPQRPSECKYFAALADQVRTAGMVQHVRFLGQRSDVGDLLQAADIYCQPNRDSEPFGLSFVEALAAGLPVVTTRLGAAPEIIDGSCGVLVEPGSVEALTHALGTLIESDSERQKMSAAASVRAREFCNLPQSLKGLSAQLARASSYSLH
ncbi:MAG: glycosyltransferase [Acidobacteria bacterium]|nr:glycosyltransferase [Acidobacteriota bacterium]